MTRNTITTQDKIKIAIKQIPNLTDFGVGLYSEYKKLPQKEQDKLLRRGQKDLLTNTEEFEKACLWLYSIKQIKAINTKQTSYGLKHLAERTVGYISNGAFIAAAVYMGFDFRIEKDSPNVMFNMSQKSLKLKDPYYQASMGIV